MSTTIDDPLLDNPVWHSLGTGNVLLNEGTDRFRYTHAEVSPFLGLPTWTPEHQRLGLSELPPGRQWFIMAREPFQLIEEWRIIFSIPLVQMVCDRLPPRKADAHSADISLLGPSHVEEMVALTARTRPGPFLRRTIEFGPYLGIFREGRLAAMGGERMHLSGRSEISAICTAPEYAGMGLGSAITHQATTAVIERGDQAFLHARHDNLGAIELYRRLGFKFRAHMDFHIIMAT